VSESHDAKRNIQNDTRDDAYTERLTTLGGSSWKRFFDVQAPYRWNIRRLKLGFTLDVGCGIGRNLLHLGGDGVGVDHNATSVAEANARGCTAFTPEDFASSEYARKGRFDSLLLAHVVEHMTAREASTLVTEQLKYVRAGGQVVLIAPQEAGYRSDKTHVEFMDFARLEAILSDAGACVERSFSFPFPRFVGRIFLHNEFVAVGRKPRNGEPDPRLSSNGLSPDVPR
jgi:2-polyprenyl-3-methyl-5-hydroxy-6-metoxy-1,4-benzoquinol methylase